MRPARGRQSGTPLRARAGCQYCLPASVAPLPACKAAIRQASRKVGSRLGFRSHPLQICRQAAFDWDRDDLRDRKSTRLNSSHTVISYAVFCLKKKKKKKQKQHKQNKTTDKDNINSYNE